MRVVLVDDEYYALEGLRMELEDIGGIEVVGMFEDGPRMLEEIKAINPDIIFLDIEMPGMSGFEILERLQEQDISANIVFITAYHHYAVKAFEINAVDYIVKPAARSRLQKTLERIKPMLKQENKPNIAIHCFRHFSIFADGKELNVGWRTKKAEELIAYLLCEKGRYISKTKIAEDLWPELNGEKSMSNLYLTCYYIKKQENQTGIKIPIELERGKMRIQTDELECDIIRFDRLVQAIPNADEWKRIKLIEEAVELYQGTLLEDSYYPWAVEHQQKCEMDLFKLLMILREHYQLIDTEIMKYYEKKLNLICG